MIERGADIRLRTAGSVRSRILNDSLNFVVDFLELLSGQPGIRDSLMAQGANRISFSPSSALSGVAQYRPGQLAADDGGGRIEEKP